MPVKAYHYANSRLKDLRSEVTSESINIDDSQLIAVSALSERSNRTLAMAIKSSGGLLQRDAVKPLPEADAVNIQAIKDALIGAELIGSEFVVICSSSNSQVIRIGRVEDLPEFASRGLRCACGKPISEEVPQELLTITDRGRFLLDKSRWMSIILKQRLIELGVLPNDILLECQMGGDEIDCIANISGELVMFELKDKEFNLGNAYSFGAKISLINPRHAVVITTAYVGNDVKDHFRRANSGRRRTFDLGSDNTVKISYIEGVENFHQGIGELVSKIYRHDAEIILRNALSFATPSSKTLLKLYW
jgi:hypothetical protein